MKKVKITVLRTMFNEDLAAEGLQHVLFTGRVKCFTPTMQNRKDSAMRRGRLFTSMYLHWPMEREMKCSITETGSESRALPYAAAMTGCAR